MTLRSLAMSALLAGLAASPLSAQPMPLNPPPNPDPAPPANESFKEIAPGVLQLGLVTLEPKQRLIKIPAVVNMKDGVVEYFLVCHDGKVHESVLATKAQPLHLHLAMLLLGFKEQPNQAPAPQNLDLSGAGVPIRISVHWQADGKEQQAAAESWIWNNKTQEPMSAGNWIYNGSKILNGTFMAQQERSIISIIADPFALMNNPRPDRENDDIWKSRSGTVPPVGTPVEVHIQWPEAQPANIPPQPNEPLTPLPPATPPAPIPPS